VLVIYVVATMLAYGTAMTSESIPIRTADYYLIVEIMLVLSVFFYLDVIHDYVALARVVKALVAGGLVSAVFAVLAHLTGVELATVLRPPGLVEKGTILNRVLLRGEVVRSQGSAGHPLELAAILTIILPIAVGLTYSLRENGKRWLPWAVATLVILVGVAVSVSRSALIGVLAAFVVMAFFWPIRRTIGMLVGAIGFATLLFAFNPPLFNAYASTLGLGTSDPSAQYRVVAARYILSRMSMFGSYGEAPGATGYIFDDQYLYRLSQGGIVGLFAYVVLLAATLTLALRAYTNARKRMNPALPIGSAQLFLGLAASLTAYAVMNVVLDVGGFVQIWTTMWLLIATSAVAYRLSRRPAGELPFT
jgi:O-antigen ligase